MTEELNTTEQATPSSGTRIARATGAIMAFQLLSFIFAYLTKRVVAHYFGTGDEADAYMIAFSIPYVYLFLVGEELLTHSFLPPFVERMRKVSEREAWKLASILGNLQAIILVVAIGIGIAVSPWLVKIFAPGFQGAKAALTVDLTRVIFPAALFLGLSTLTYVILNAYKIFALPASGWVAFRLGIVTCAILLCGGCDPCGKYGVMGIAIGVVVGGAIKLLVNLVGLWRKRGLYQPALDLKYPPLGKVGWLMLPLLIGVIAAKIRPYADNAIASTLGTGGVSSLRYARALADLPIQVFPYALGIALFPFMTDLATNGDRTRLAQMMVSAFRVILFVFVPMAVAMVLLSEPTVRLAWQSGKFVEQSVWETVPPLICYAIGLPVFAAEIVILQVFFSMADTKTPVIIGLWCLGLHVAIAAGSVFGLHLAQVGIALAFTISKTAKVAILVGLIKRKLGEIPWGDTPSYLVKLTICTLALAGGIWASLGVISLRVDTTAASGWAAQFLGPTIVGIAIFLALAFALKLEETRRVVELVRKRLRRKM